MKRILSLLLIITVLACGMINAAAETPSVTIEGIENGQTIEYGTEVAAIVSAASSYNKITLLLNGEEAASAESATERFVLSDVPSGRNVLKAVAEGDYGKAVSEEVEFFYLVRNEETLANDDFETETDGNRAVNVTLPTVDSVWIGEATNDSGYSIITDSGKTGYTGSKIEIKKDVLSSLSQNGFLFEFDTQRIMKSDDGPVVSVKIFMQTDKGTVALGGIRRDGGATGTYWPCITLRDKKEDNSLYQIFRTVNKTWYHIKYEVDLSKGRAELFYAEGKGNQEDMISLGVREFASSTSVSRIYLENSGYANAADANPQLMLDNISFEQSKTSPYLKTPSFETYGVVAENGKIPANPTKISIPFSITMNKDTLSDGAFKFTSEGKDVDVAELSYDKDANEVVIIPKKQLTANKPYKLTVAEGAKTSGGMDVPTELVYSFDTPLNDFDIIEAVAIGDNGPVALADISSGDTLSFECKLQNKTAYPVEGVVIFAVYENGVLSHLDVNDLFVAENSDIAYASSAAQYTFKTKPDSVEIYVWKSMTERISLAPAQTLK